MQSVGQQNIHFFAILRAGILERKKSVNKEEKPVTVSVQLQFSVSVYLLPL